MKLLTLTFLMLIYSGQALPQNSKFIGHSNDNRKTLFILEKSHNYENVMVIHAKTDRECRFVRTSNANNYINFYWLMDFNNPDIPAWEKTPHRLIMRETNQRVQFQNVSHDRRYFEVSLNDVDEYVRHDLEEVTARVYARVIDGECRPQVKLTLGPSRDYQTIILESVFGKAKTIFGIPQRAVEYIIIRGRNVDTGEVISVRFNEK